MSEAIPPAAFEGLRAVTAAEMAALDRRAAREFGISVLDLMENAGKAAAEETARFIRDQKKEVAGTKIMVCCGRGNKGGDGLVAARHLKAMGCRVFFLMIPPKPGASYGPEVLENLKRAMAAGVAGRQMGEDRVAIAGRLASADLVIDAVLGTGSSGKPRGEAEDLIREMGRSGRPILAVDLPSGLDPDTGEPADPCVKAARTLTLALPKKGLLAEKARPYVGELRVLDIGFPRELAK